MGGDQSLVLDDFDDLEGVLEEGEEDDDGEGESSYDEEDEDEDDDELDGEHLGDNNV